MVRGSDALDFTLVRDMSEMEAVARHLNEALASARMRTVLP